MDISHYKTSPIGSILLVEEGLRSKLLDAYMDLPPNIKSIAASPNTGAYIRGLMKTHQLPEDMAGDTALMVLRIFLGEKILAELPALLSAKLGIANDKAQRIATEIEKDLLAPVSLELNKYLAQKKQQQGSMSGKIGSPLPTSPVSQRGYAGHGTPSQPQNVLNLKDMEKPPSPPNVPPRR